MSLSFAVVSRNFSEAVGSITARPGLRTSNGVVSRVTSATVYFQNGSIRRNLDGITVSHSEARNFGYPNSNGCNRFRVVRCRSRNRQTVLA